MGKHIEKLRQSNPDRKITNQEFMNVLGEALQENIEIVKAAQRNIDAILNKPPEKPKKWWKFWSKS